MAKDILFDADGGLFGLRSAGVLIKDNKVLLQQVGSDPSYAIPGGHVSFGELGEEALIREFKEETGMDIKVVRMLWIGEIFFPLNDKDCHQICIYYLVEPAGATDEPVIWDTVDKVESYEAHIKFSWVDIGDLDGIEIYPTQAKGYLKNISGQIKHFVYKEQ